MKTVFSLGSLLNLVLKSGLKNLFLQLILLIFIGSEALFAQGWIQKHTGMIPSVNPNIRFSAVDNNMCWGLSNTNSQFCRTTNGGIDWTVSRIPDANGLRGADIAAIDANTAYALMTNVSNLPKSIFKTTDGGLNWTKQNIFGLRSAPVHIHFFDLNNGVVIGNPNQDKQNYEIYTTSDGGSNWNLVPDSNLPAFSAMSIATGFASVGNNIWLGTVGEVSESFYLYKSTDRGLTWSKNNKLGSVTLHVAFKDSLNGLACNCFEGLGNRISRTTDGGETWTAIQNVPTNISAAYITYVPGTNECYVITSDNNIGNPVPTKPGSMCSFDDGNTWQTLDELPHGPISSSSDGTGWSPGIEKVYKSVPEQNRKWYTQYLGLVPTPNPSFGFAPVDSKVCWGIQLIYPGTKNPKCVLTTDGGENWKIISLPFASEMTANSISALDANTAWIVMEGNGGGVYKTINGGVDWKRQETAFPTGSGAHASLVYFFNFNDGVSIGRPRNGNWEIYTTSDGGENWVLVPSINIPLPGGTDDLPLTVTSTKSDNCLWFNSLSRAVYRTTNKGKTWNVSRNINNTPDQRHPAGSVFKDELNGIAYTYFGDRINRASMTTDGGVTWTILPDQPKEPSFYAIAYDPVNDLYIVTSHKNIGVNATITPGSMYTKDFVNWKMIDELFHGPAAFSKDGTGWSSGPGDIIYKWSGIATDVEEMNTKVKDFRLEQNYPNPFNPSTTISFSIPADGFVTLKVYDLLGKEIVSLVNEEKRAGIYKVSFNGANLTSGIYLYKLQAGSFSEIKKMILLK